MGNTPGVPLPELFQYSDPLTDWCNLITPSRFLLPFMCIPTEEVIRWSQDFNFFYFDRFSFTEFFQARHVLDDLDDRIYMRTLWESLAVTRRTTTAASGAGPGGAGGELQETASSTSTLDAKEVFTMLIMLSSGPAALKMNQLYNMFCGGLQEE